MQPQVTLFPGEEPLAPINRTLSGRNDETVGKVVLYSYSIYISVLQFLKKHGVGLSTFVTEDAQCNTVQSLRVHSFAPVWCLDCYLY